MQKCRNLLKLWNAMMDENAIYVIPGAELQEKVHYGMPRGKAEEPCKGPISPLACGEAEKKL